MTQLRDDSNYNPDCKVINNSGKDLLILNAENMPSNAENAVPQIMYEQTLTELTLKDSTDTILKANSTGTIELNETYNDPDDEPTISRIYELILADPSDLSPVKNVLQDYNEPDNFADPPTPGYYSDITVSDDDAKQMSKAIEFLQVINAYPSSNLAKSFVAALKSTDGSLSDKTESIMKQFFESTKGYTEVDFPAYVLASTYQSTYAASWYPPSTDVPYNTDHAIKAHSEYSYWLYSAANMGGGNGGANKASCLGKVMFLNAPSGTPNDHNSGMQVYFTKDWWMIPDTTDKPLYFDKGQLVDEITDIPGIALQTIWAVKGTFTNDASDSTLWPTLVGTVGNVDVIGIPMHAEDGWDNFADFWSQLTFQSVLSYFLTLMGVVMAIDFIKTKVEGRVEAYQDYRANRNQGQPLTPEQEAEVKSLSDRMGAAARMLKAKLAARLGRDSATGRDNVNVPSEEMVTNAQNTAQDVAIQAAKDRIQAARNAAKAAADKALADFEKQIEEVARINNGEEVQDAGDYFEAAQEGYEQALNSGDFTEVSNNLALGQARLNVALSEVINISPELQAKLDAWEQSVTDFSKAARAAKDVIEEADTEIIEE